MALPVVAIVGPSKSGKTTVACALIQCLTSAGYRVAAVKHAHHGHQVDRPATDSARLYQAGAATIVLSSPGKVTTIERSNTDLTLEEIVQSLGDCYDIVVAEGFKRSSVPKILVLGQEVIPVPVNVIAAVGAGLWPDGIPAFAPEQTNKLAQLVVERLIAVSKSRAVRSVT